MLLASTIKREYLIGFYLQLIFYLLQGFEVRRSDHMMQMTYQCATLLLLNYFVLKQSFGCFRKVPKKGAKKVQTFKEIFHKGAAPSPPPNLSSKPLAKE